MKQKIKNLLRGQLLSEMDNGSQFKMHLELNKLDFALQKFVYDIPKLSDVDGHKIYDIYDSFKESLDTKDIVENIYMLAMETHEDDEDAIHAVTHAFEKKIQELIVGKVSRLRKQGQDIVDIYEDFQQTVLADFRKEMLEIIKK